MADDKPRFAAMVTAAMAKGAREPNRHLLGDFAASERRALARSTISDEEKLSAWNASLRRHTELLFVASSQAEWCDVLAQILQHWICMGRPGLFLNYDRAKLTAAVRAGFKPPPHRAMKGLRAREDASLILRHMSGKPWAIINGRPVPPDPVRTLADAARCIAAASGATSDVARKRALAAEKELGIKLPRAPRYGRPTRRPRPVR